MHLSAKERTILAKAMANILIVEDEIFVASEMEAILQDAGHTIVGIAADQRSASSFAADAPIDVAFVDLNLRDGHTGPEIGQQLGGTGTAVVFVTANPRMLGDGVAGTIGVLTKPTEEAALLAALDFALARRRGAMPPPPPALRLFG
jgi:two-component system, response regulator PdtaR